MAATSMMTFFLCKYSSSVIVSLYAARSWSADDASDGLAFPLSWMIPRHDEGVMDDDK